MNPNKRLNKQYKLLILLVVMNKKNKNMKCFKMKKKKNLKHNHMVILFHNIKQDKMVVQFKLVQKVMKMVKLL